MRQCFRLPWLAWSLAEAGSKSFLFLKITFSFAFSGYVCVYVHMCMCTYMCHGPVWRSEGNLQGSVLFFYRAGPRKGTQVARLCGKSLIHGALSLSPGHFECLRPSVSLMQI